MTNSKVTIGVIGLGLMGNAIAGRLIATGQTVVGCDISPDRVAAARELGVGEVASPAAVAEAADVVLVSVTTTQAVADVTIGQLGIAQARNPRAKIVVDLSTTEIPVTRQIASELDRMGIGFVDAPVSGGPDAARTGTLAIMAGGRASAIATAEPIMKMLGRFTHMGDVGAGQATKLVNQALVLTNYCVLAEALRLAQAYGVDASRVPHALETGHAGSNLLPVLFPRMNAEDFAPRGYARQVLKDLEMLNDAAGEKHLAMPMAGQALAMFRMLVAGGNSELDGSSVVTLLPRPRP